MSVSNIAARKLGYASRKTSKQKDEARNNNNQDLGQILGEDSSNDLFSNINGGTLSYVSEQIKKQRKRREHQRAKSTVPEAQPQTFAVQQQQRNTHREASYEKQEDKISEIEAYQEETERYSSEKPGLKDQLQYAMALKFQREREEQPDSGIKRSQSSDNMDQPELEVSSPELRAQQQPEGDFINNLLGYIDCLEKKPQAHRRGKTTPIHIRKTPVSRTREKQNSIDLQLYHQRESKQQQYQRKYKREKEESGIIAKQLQRYKRLCEQQKEHILRLEDKLKLVQKQCERTNNRQQLQRERFEDLRQFVLKASAPTKNDTFEVFELLSPKVRPRELQRRRQYLDADALQEEYRDLLMKYPNALPTYKRTTEYYSSK